MKHSFLFQANFDAPLDLIQGKSIFLNCEGLDTVAIVTLNNVEIGSAENMFRRYRFNIGQAQDIFSRIFRTPIYEFF